jgi:hypothetical protein
MNEKCCDLYEALALADCLEIDGQFVRHFNLENHFEDVNTTVFNNTVMDDDGHEICFSWSYQELKEAVFNVVMKHWELQEHTINVYMLDCINNKSSDAVIAEELHDNYAHLWQSLEDGVLNDDPDAFFNLREKYRESMALTAYCRFKRQRKVVAAAT